MPRISDYEILESKKQLVIFISGTVDYLNLRETIHKCFAKLRKFLNDNNVVPANSVYVKYEHMDPSTEPLPIQYEIGYAVSKRFSSCGDIQYGYIPKGLYATCYFLGSYNDIINLYGDILAWIDEKGYTSGDKGAYEYYYNSRVGCEVDDSHTLTQIAVPIFPKK